MDVTSNQSLLHLKSYMTGNNKDHSWVILTAELQLNVGTLIPKNLNIFNKLKYCSFYKYSINITINLDNDSHPVLN